MSYLRSLCLFPYSGVVFLLSFSSFFTYVVSCPKLFILIAPSVFSNDYLNYTDMINK